MLLLAILEPETQLGFWMPGESVALAARASTASPEAERTSSWSPVLLSFEPLSWVELAFSGFVTLPLIFVTVLSLGNLLPILTAPFLHMGSIQIG